MADLSEKALSYIRNMRDQGVLEGIKEGILPTDQGTIVVPCADGHQLADLYEHHRSTCGGGMNHPLSLNGGALLIPENSILRRRVDGTYTHADEVLLENIVEAVELKQAKAVVIMAHAPCGKVAGSKLYMPEVFELLSQAKTRVRLAVEPLGAKVAAHFHVCRPNGERRTYHFRQKVWEKLSGAA